MIRPSFVALAAVLVACGGSPERAEETRGMPGMAHGAAGPIDTAGLRDRPVPSELEPGRDAFRTYCAQCHGEAALGTASGPPLVHVVYEPSHHGDAAFILAAERGVRAHHWRFGDMPPVPGVSRAELEEIVRYVRWLQREAGVF